MPSIRIFSMGLVSCFDVFSTAFKFFSFCCFPISRLKRPTIACPKSQNDVHLFTIRDDKLFNEPLSFGKIAQIYIDDDGNGDDSLTDKLLMSSDSLSTGNIGQVDGGGNGGRGAVLELKSFLFCFVLFFLFWARTIQLSFLSLLQLKTSPTCAPR